MRRTLMSLVACSFFAAACAPTQTGGNDPATEAARAHEVQLQRTFDRVSSSNLTEAAAAAAELASLPTNERDSLARYWLRRTSMPQVAKLLGEALLLRGEASAASALPEASAAFEWFQRGLKSVDGRKDYVLAAEFRLLMARSHLMSGDRLSALELAANRLDPRPLPDELEARYAEFMAKLAG